MIDAFLQPMFEPTGPLFGISLSVATLGLTVVTVVASALATIYLVRRYSRSEGEYRSFRATTHPDPTDRVVRGAILAAVVFAAVFALGIAAG